MSAGSLLSLDGVSVQYGAVEVLSEVSIKVPLRGFVGLIGPNGAGKTTLFNTISGFTRPRCGTVHFEGQDITRRSATARARLGVVRTFQNVGLNKGVSVEENLLSALTTGPMALELRDLFAPLRGRPEHQRAVGEVLEGFGLACYRHTVVRDLSTGTAKMVELAAALLRRPKLLLLDEPSSGLSPEETDNLAVVLNRLHGSEEVAILMIEHDMSLVGRTADFLYCLDFGTLIAGGTPATVRSDQRVVDAYLGKGE